MTDNIESAEALLSWNLTVDCPYCGEENDLADPYHDCEGYFSTPIFNNKWEEIDGKEADCQKCGKTFSVSSVVY